MSKRFIRRSLLYMPGSSEKMLNKAAGLTADAVIMDLEDAVSIPEKDAARERVLPYIAEIRNSGKEAIVRVNGMDTMWGIRDILAAAPYRPDTIIIPKADERALTIADGLLCAVEREQGWERNTISLIPLFETAYSIVNPLSILSVTDRVDGVQLGGEDLTKEQEIERTLLGEEIRYARHQLAMAARAKGLDILDTPYTGIRDLDGLRQDAEAARQIGFTGKTCIHPTHAPVINDVFSPSAEAVAYSRGVLEAYTAAVAEGKGAVMYQNKMIDAPIADRASRILNKAQRIMALEEKQK